MSMLAIILLQQFTVLDMHESKPIFTTFDLQLFFPLFNLLP